MGPERGELFMRQRYKDRIGVEFEPPLIEVGTDGYDEAGGDMGAEMPTPEVEPEHEDDERADADGRADEVYDPDHDVRDPNDGGVFLPSLDDVDETRGEESPAGNAADGKTGPESTEARRVPRRRWSPRRQLGPIAI